MRDLDLAAIDAERLSWLRKNLNRARVDYRMRSGSSLHLRDPHGARLELIADPLGQVHGVTVL